MAAKQRNQDFALGLTTIVFAALFLGTILFIYPMFKPHGKEITIHFRHEDGMAPLKEGSAVVLGGSMEVGRVSSVRLKTVPIVSGNESETRTVFVVKAEIAEYVVLHGDCQITTNQPAIGGGGYVSILSIGTPDVPLVMPIEGLPPQSLTAAVSQLSNRLLGAGGMLENLEWAVDPHAEGSVLYKVGGILDNLDATTAQLRDELSPASRKALIAKLHSILDDINEMTTVLRAQMDATDDTRLLAKVHVALDRLTAGLEEASHMLKEDRPLLRGTLQSIAHATKTIDEKMLDQLAAELDVQRPGSLLAKTHAAMDRTNNSLQSLENTVVTGERMVKLSRPTIEKALLNVEATTAHLEHAALKILMNPHALLAGPEPAREEQLRVFQAARSFAEAAAGLDRASGSLRAIMETLPENGDLAELDAEELSRIYAAIQAAFQRFERAEEVLWEELK